MSDNHNHDEDQEQPVTNHDETQETNETAQETQEGQEQPQEPDHGDEYTTLIAESKKYRKRAQDAEQAHQELQDRHTNLIRSVAEHQAHKAGVNAAALWGAGTTPGDLLDDDGNLDYSKIDQAAHTARRHFGLGQGVENPLQGRGASGPPSEDWADIFRG